MNATITKTDLARKVLLSGGIAAVMLLATLVGAKDASAAITSSLDIGSQGSQVTELQTYLARDTNIYPSGLVTGYFGPLTQAAVQRFQAAQGIVSSGSPATTGYGRVGPQTMARLNALMGTGGIVQAPWDAVPVLSFPSVQYTNTSATFTWTSSEPTMGQVYYDVFPIRADEATGPRQLPFVSGKLAADTSGLRTSHSITVTNLQPNTIYYYITRGIDSGGNMSMTLPTPFRTNQ
jgi:peptidoglycan hydrolase-like protein with peptidoglycan-binding domain